MIKKPGGDIEGLFRSFGSDGGSYRELAREADAQAAQERWPMLGQIAPEAGVRPKELDAGSKQHWREQGGAFRGAGLSAPTPSADGARLSGGLNHLLRRGDAPAGGTDVAPPPTGRRPLAQAAAPAAPAFGGLFQRAARPERPHAPPAPSPTRKSGLFSTPEPSTKADDAGRSSSLSNMFSRLEGSGVGKRLGLGRPRKR